MKCQLCGVEVYMPFKCNYCGQTFCGEHRLPENHNCPEYWRVKVPKEQPPAKSGSWYHSGFTVQPTVKHNRLVWFSKKEVQHLLVGVLLALAIGFSMPLYGNFSLYNDAFLISSLATIFAFSFITHEIVHKITAQRSGLWAEFRVTLYGVAITLISVISPFKIIAPGAVMIGGMAKVKTIGKIAISGPLTNITLALLFLLCTKIFYNFPIAYAFAFGVSINSVIALFNLIPFGVLDGLKIFMWNKIAWATVFAVSLVLTVYSYLGFSLL